ncbi:MAG: hypothetical protein L0219_18395 [Phycisphaerales bacterium]|nr:hypothetical protein [Phycisphaerales bacterium]
MASDAEFLEAFEARRWPRDQWHHREHIRLAYLYLRAYSFEEAVQRVRTGIKAHNAAHGVPDGPTSGYHETMTIAWLGLVEAMLAEYGPEENSEAFWDAHPELSQKKALRLFYSKERFMSPEAKTRFIEPDLAPLPRARGACRGQKS